MRAIGRPICIRDVKERRVIIPSILGEISHMLPDTTRDTTRVTPRASSSLPPSTVLVKPPRPRCATRAAKFEWAGLCGAGT